MSAKIVEVHVWHDAKDGGRGIAEVFYSTGASKRYYNSYSQSWPQTVRAFINRSTDCRKVNSQVVEYR